MSINSQCKYKYLSFIISLKRDKKNSCIKKIPKYLLCKRYNLSVNTFSKYLQQSINQGHIFEKGGYYHVVSFSKIISELFSDSGLYFAKHEIIRTNKTTNFKEILHEIEQVLIIDNVIERQSRMIEKKRIYEIFQNIGTDKIARSKWYSLPYKTRLSLSKSFIKKRVHVNIENFTDDIITSARHTSKLLGMSMSKSNSLLNRAQMFDRSIKVSWIKGISDLKYFEAIAMFPKATVIPCFKIDMIKICHGSTLKYKSLVCN